GAGGFDCSQPILGRRTHSNGEYACATTHSEREPTGRIGPAAWKTKHRRYGAGLCGIIVLTASTLVVQINIDERPSLAKAANAFPRQPVSRREACRECCRHWPRTPAPRRSASLRPPHPTPPAR